MNILRKTLHRRIMTAFTAILIIIPLFLTGNASKKNKLGIIDYRGYLNVKFKRTPRQSTRYIIVHTSEAGLVSTLRTVSAGKSVGRYRTVGGHAHYVIARDGKIYRIMDHIYRADHAGLSMWCGLEDISSHSLGIELVGYHYSTITPEQYKALSGLLKVLQRVYNMADKSVLTHSQVSYGKPNRWFRRPHRGRKRCALNFERDKAGLTDCWTYDPDVRSRRLARDRHIHAMFYKKRPRTGKKKTVLASAKQPDSPPSVKNGKKGTSLVTPPSVTLPEELSNVISKDNTAWNIAGEDYDDETTLYVLPGNRKIRGDSIENEIGWSKIPIGTRVLVNQPKDVEKKSGPLFVLGKEYTAWSFAGAQYSSANTFYFFPDGRFVPGNKLPDWDAIPNGTRMIIGYKGPFTVRNVTGQTPWGIAGRAHNHADTIYFIPGKGVVQGDRITDFSDLPRGSKIFMKRP